MHQRPPSSSSVFPQTRRGVTLLVILLSAFCIHWPLRAEPPAGYPFLSYDEGLRLAQQQGKRIFLYFGRLGCTWCDKTNALAFSNADVRKRYTDRYVLVYVDAEGDKRLQLPSGEIITEAEVGMRFRAFATPCSSSWNPTAQRSSRSQVCRP